MLCEGLHLLLRVCMQLALSGVACKERLSHLQQAPFGVDYVAGAARACKPPNGGTSTPMCLCTACRLVPPPK